MLETQREYPGLLDCAQLHSSVALPNTRARGSASAAKIDHKKQLLKVDNALRDTFLIMFQRENRRGSV